MTRFAVALCTYNGAAYLGEQLRSIAGQTRPPDHMMVVDDRSTDSSVEIARDFARTVPFPVEVRVNDVNLGVSANFQRAVELAQGDLIALSDQDDVWHPDKLATLERTFDAHPNAGLVYSNATVVDSSLRPAGLTLWSAVDLAHATPDDLHPDRVFRRLLRGNVITGATLAFRGELRDLVLPFDPRFLHDAWLALVVAGVSDVVGVDAPLVLYRQHGQNVIGARPPLRTLRARFRQGRILRGRVLPLHHAQLAATLQRLRERGGAQPGRLTLLEDAEAHFGARTTVLERRASRVGLVARELTRGGYHRLSDGFLSALRDLI